MLQLPDDAHSTTLADAYAVAYDYQAQFVTKVADDMLNDLRAEIDRHPSQRVAFVGRDGRSLAIALSQLDMDFYQRHCTEVVLSRVLVETAVQDLEQHQGKSFPQIDGFRRAAAKVDPGASAGAVHALSDYLHDQGVPAGLPGSRVTLVDSSYKGTVQELLSAVYDKTRFDGRYAFFGESPHDAHPGSKRGYALHLESPESNGGLPLQSLPDDPALTFANQDAIGCVEETMHGPFDSPRRFVSDLVWQDGLRFQERHLDGLNPNVVSARMTDPAVREGVMHVNLLAVHDFARDAAAFRDRGGPHHEILDDGARRFRAQVRGWIARGPADPRFAEMMDAFVRRTDKSSAAGLAEHLRRGKASALEARKTWEAFGACASDADKKIFVENYGNANLATGATHGRTAERPRRGMARDGRPGREP
jgi:hypothetical protein